MAIDEPVELLVHAEEEGTTWGRDWVTSRGQIVAHGPHSAGCWRVTPAIDLGSGVIPQPRRNEPPTTTPGAAAGPNREVRPSGTLSPTS